MPLATRQCGRRWTIPTTPHPTGGPTKILILASSIVFLASATLAQSVPEKSGANSALGIVPKTQDFVTLAAQSDMLEIEASKLALTKAESAKTKEFADKMIKDHTATSNSLGNVESAAGHAADYSRRYGLPMLGWLAAGALVAEDTK